MLQGGVEGERKSVLKYWFLHKQINTEGVVLADTSKDKKINRTEDDISEDKLLYAFYFSINAFLGTTYLQVTSTDTCNNTPISIQVLKTLYNFSTVNFRREKKRRGAAMRGGCSWTTLLEKALLSEPTERSGKQTSLNIWYKHSLTQLCVLVFLQSYNILSLCSCCWKNTGNWDLFDKLCVAHLFTSRPKLTGCKDRKDPSPLGHFQKKKTFRKNIAFKDVSF